MSEDMKGRKAPKTVIEQGAGAEGARVSRTERSGAADTASDQGEKRAGRFGRRHDRQDGAADGRRIPGTVRVVRDVLGDTDEHFERYAGSHKNTVLCGLIGLIAALLVLFLGFWSTLVIALFVLIGVIIGQALDGDNGIVNFFRRHFGGR